ncbi:hypothetical protein HQ393_07890 [Chitinibacter bivalviorum]|uniref:Virulence RhuM family protein n=1 Tax=Chitinibacter bivalviorum TaxID=2739434 RepID=A0A7H9BHT0_9NEIS|nr:hypothetical protein [Chitinibacter bivalviorum]QLG88175.1 hypothetical protein HQ393_07890 [Chitinibacter bivalviorum]
MGEITIYRADNGTVEVRVAQETVWLSQEQMANVFGVQKAAISKHLKNIFASGELEQRSNRFQNGNSWLRLEFLDRVLIVAGV